MRIFLVFLVILNLLYAGWEYMSPSTIVKSIPPLPDKLQTLELLRETRGMEAKQLELVENEESGNALDDAAETIIEERVSVDACYTLGPFKDKNIMQQHKESLAEQLGDITVRKLVESEKHRYWVHLPAQSSRKKAKEMAAILRANDVNDFYIVLSGKARNSISLGHFREPAHASRRVKGVINKGFKAQIEVIYRDYDIFWLDYKIKENESNAEFNIVEYVTGGVSQLVRDCN